MELPKSSLNRAILLEQLKLLVPKGDLLELCGGTGELGCELAGSGYRIYETDLSQQNLIYAKNTFERKRLEAALFAMVDAERIPFYNDSFDAIVMMASLHHLQKPKVALKQAVRCLRKGGYLFIWMEPSSNYIRYIAPIVFRFSGTQHSRGDLETNGYSLDDFEAYGEEIGLPIYEVRPFWFLVGIIDLIQKGVERKIFKTKFNWKLLDLVALTIDELVFAIPGFQRLA